MPATCCRSSVTFFSGKSFNYADWEIMLMLMQQDFNLPNKSLRICEDFKSD